MSTLRALTPHSKSIILCAVPMATNNNNQNVIGCSAPLKGCLIVSAIVMALFLVALIHFSRMPSVHAIGTCKYNLQELAAAVSRYEDVTGSRPEKLKDLAGQYLSDKSVLKCPLDKTSDKTSSYTYNPKAKGGQVMIECDRHRLKKDMPNSRLRVLGDGKFEIKNPGFRETVKEAEKHSR
jgi:hypothetical protein